MERFLVLCFCTLLNPKIQYRGLFLLLLGQWFERESAWGMAVCREQGFAPKLLLLGGAWLESRNRRLKKGQLPFILSFGTIRFPTETMLCVHSRMRKVYFRFSNIRMMLLIDVT